MSFICPIEVVSGNIITKALRHMMFGKGSGATSTKHEKYARAMIEQGTGTTCKKTNMRINLRNHTLKNIAHPNNHLDGFDYTEDFDGKQTIGKNTV